MGANSWATPSWKHNEQPDCKFDDASVAIYNGIICPDTVQVRRIAFSGYSPSHFDGMEMKIAKYDNHIRDSFDEAGLEEYLDNSDNYSTVFFKAKLKPTKGWAMPFVTGYKYRVHWAEGLDFERMKVDVSERW